MIYDAARRALFRLDPERAHALTLDALRVAGALPLARIALGRALRFEDPRLAVEAFGLRFRNPLGLAAGYDKWRFLGTSAWFFFAVNLTKLPVSISQSIVRPDTALLAGVLAPLVLIGTWIGRLTIKRIDQATFERLVTLFIAVSAVYLVFS